ncbi:Palmitoyl-protein thioesterase [Spironucleus salmonicida]|uniref:Palmitoyl-protein thioesterase n=1 Tax=Spironucleus salmonicida TaxID=348837 RepID=V6LLL7_9EUKA|nr:Palmitoyl-protein thioesterase [Spironucleus salmonicida]|eukprot:EST45575.1 Palmitoyl-protein thioesterase [Spironucleus salmonicida]
MFVTLLAQYPIVLIHGFDSSAHYLEYMKEVIQEQIPDATVINCEIGNGRWDSIFMEISQQIKLLAECISENSATQGGYIGVGHSQGGYLMRALLEEYNHKMAPMVRFISLSSPQSGFFCGVKSLCKGNYLPTFVQKLLFYLQYKDFAQSRLSPAQYWRNPYKLKAYAKKARSLPVMDNIRDYNIQRKINFMSVDRVILFGGPLDEVISPWQSAFFGVWKDGTDGSVSLYHDREEYKQDTFGLGSMVEQGKVEFKVEKMFHGDYTTNYKFIAERLTPYLRMN